LNQSSDKLLLANGKIFNYQSHDAVYIENGRIKEIGDSHTLFRNHTNVQATDLNGALLLPGLGDAHMHMAVGGKSLGVINLVGMNFGQVIKTLQAAVDNGKEEWIVAFNWNRSLCALDVKKLNEVKTNLPIIVHAVDLHSCCCSQIALDRAGIDRSTPDPQNGKIIRDSSGKPNGNLMESASDPVTALVPPPSNEQWRKHILDAQNHLLSLGLTSVSEVLQPELEKLYWGMDREDNLILNIDGWRRIESWNGEPPVAAGNRFRVQTLKLFLDGAFGSRTAALNEPYNDDPTQNGLLFFDDDKLLETLIPAVEAGWRLAIHALGDKAVSQACRVLAQLPQTGINSKHRIEHAQFISADGVDELIRSGAIISIQPVHLLDDIEWLPGRLGTERCRRMFVWKSILEAGGTLAIGSDWPVASPNPLLNLHVAINRCGFHEDKESTFDNNEALSPIEAVKAITEGWASATGMPKNHGTIEEGAVADLTVISGYDTSLQDWSDAVVEMTICEGRVVYSRAS